MSSKSIAARILQDALARVRADESIPPELKVEIGWTLIDAGEAVWRLGWARIGGIAKRLDPMEQEAYRA